ncbi:MAG: sugar-binding protein, partial [Phycisphaerae bacterium]|nr:sugar-binding protein [Phycisphaerae bacterium]
MTKLCAMAAVVLAVLVSPAGAARTIYGEPYEAPKVAAPALLMQRALVVDGKLDEWAGIPAVFITGPYRTVLGGTKWTGNNDLSARLRLAWNTDGLLLALEVDDDVLKNPFKGTPATWQGDCIELFLDAREPAKRDGKHGKGTFQIFCTPGLTTDQKADCIYSGKLNEPAGMKVASTITATGYIMEIAIPFFLVPGVEGAEGQTIGIDVAIDDCDNEARDEQLVWAGTGNNWADTSRFATVTLVGKGIPTTLGETLDTLFAVSLEPADKQTVSVGLFLPGWAVMVVKSASLELKPPDGKTVFAVSDIPWRADGSLYTATAEIDVSLLDDGNYDLRISLKGKDGKVFKEITRRCQLREQGTARVSSKEWYKVSKDQVKSR